MYELKIISQFAAAHQLRESGGKCERLHGHNWKVEVYVQGEQLGEHGLLIDFKDIKRAANQVLERLDHRFLNDIPAFESTNPSSENIARHLFESLSKEINGDRVRVSKVPAW